MGGLLSYIPGLWVAYIAGAVGLAGLPYWSGYYCKSATWAAVTQSGGYWIGVRGALLLSTLLTYCYLGRLAFLVFGGLRSGHQSLYRPRWLSLFVCCTLLILGWVVAYCGNFWEFILQVWVYSLGGGWETWEWLYFSFWGLVGGEGWGGLQGLYSLGICLLWTCYLERVGFGSWRGLYVTRVMLFMVFGLML
jgi:NADH:ubiquinone oxidoreductase subunit 5 (subunit L)/multisubunit Na+/H+ antiporter MnhA subunit